MAEIKAKMKHGHPQHGKAPKGIHAVVAYGWAGGNGVRVKDGHRQRGNALASIAAESPRPDLSDWMNIEQAIKKDLQHVLQVL
ncbi:hypothetical protein [Acidovorax carolinensis]|uniref:hypothetical protein n=1 Tax=Acidovorax carolinensis TaxID=553814 RepID=UPI00138FE963|nr:hypothetical protein [Acidovorax carolinensis]